MRLVQKYSKYINVSSALVINELVALCHRRWTLPVLAALDRTGGIRLVELQHALNVARETARRALSGCQAQKLLERNPGYGHPLRPEYVLTPRGARFAPHCRVLQALIAPEHVEYIGRKWSLPVLAALATGCERFSEIQALLQTATPRALTQALEALVSIGYLRREIVEARPPRTRYVLTDRGQIIAEAALQLAMATADRGEAR